jgi:hypothetical protein
MQQIRHSNWPDSTSLGQSGLAVQISTDSDRRTIANILNNLIFEPSGVAVALLPVELDISAVLV